MRRFKGHLTRVDPRTGETKCYNVDMAKPEVSRLLEDPKTSESMTKYVQRIMAGNRQILGESIKA
jgi:hypothetical protein